MSESFEKCQNIVSLDCLCLQTRVPRRRTRFYCCYAVTEDLFPSKSSFVTRHVSMDCYGRLGTVETGVELAHEVDDRDVNRVTKVNLPYCEDIPECLYLRKTIDIEGSVLDNAQRFAVNLLTDSRQNVDVFFHFNPRFDRRVVIRNHRRRGYWGEEEIAVGQPFPFEVGQAFKMSLFVADGAIMVSVNGHHFCSFSIRMPLESVRSLAIEGDISVSLIHHHNTNTYPALPRPVSSILHLQVPKSRKGNQLVFEKDTEVFAVGSVLEINGRVKMLPQGFYINLQVGSALIPHPMIPLHINLRLCQPGLQEQQMVYNSWVQGGWGTEKKPENCPFLPGTSFQLVIVYLNDSFHVAVNREFLIAFPLRLPYPPLIDTILVEGDVVIEKVKVSSK